MRKLCLYAGLSACLSFAHAQVFFPSPENPPQIPAATMTQTAQALGVELFSSEDPSGLQVLSYNPGQALQLNARVAQDSYLYLFQAAGDSLMPILQGVFVAGGSSYSQALSAASTPGPQRVVAFVSRQPLAMATTSYSALMSSADSGNDSLDYYVVAPAIAAQPAPAPQPVAVQPAPQPVAVAAPQPVAVQPVAVQPLATAPVAAPAPAAVQPQFVPAQPIQAAQVVGQAVTPQAPTFASVGPASANFSPLSFPTAGVDPAVAGVQAGIAVGGTANGYGTVIPGQGGYSTGTMRSEAPTGTYGDGSTAVNYVTNDGARYWNSRVKIPALNGAVVTDVLESFTRSEVAFNIAAPAPTVYNTLNSELVQDGWVANWTNDTVSGAGNDVIRGDFIRMEYQRSGLSLRMELHKLADGSYRLISFLY
ncbi:MAG: hypothetical protein R2880_13515 [Deinococcales bacterium]